MTDIWGEGPSFTDCRWCVRGLAIGYRVSATAPGTEADGKMYRRSVRCPDCIVPSRGPTFHRFGHKYDHGLVGAVMRFKVWNVQKQAKVTKEWTKLRMDVGLQAEFNKAHERAKEKLMKRRVQAAELVPLEQQYKLSCEAVDEARRVRERRIG